MANERLGIVEERQRDRAMWGDYEYRAPVSGLAKETAITVDLATGARTVEEFVRKKVDEVLNSGEIQKAISGSLERFIQQAINRSEEMRAWRERQLSRVREGSLPEVDFILQIVWEVTGITHAELRSPRRARSLSWPRHLACWLISKLRPDLSLPQIGRLLGGRDHTTIMHGRKHVDRKLDEAPFKAWLADPRIIALLEGR
jgi:chromosomal replication initiation ATPase DnaA